MKLRRLTARLPVESPSVRVSPRCDFAVEKDNYKRNNLLSIMILRSYLSTALGHKFRLKSKSEEREG